MLSENTKSKIINYIVEDISNEINVVDFVRNGYKGINSFSDQELMVRFKVVVDACFKPEPIEPDIILRGLFMLKNHWDQAARANALEEIEKRKLEINWVERVREKIPLELLYEEALAEIAVHEMLESNQ